MNTIKTFTRYTLYTVLYTMFLSSCTPLDTSLDGKILTDKCGNVYKLEWQAGWGATWAFKYPVEIIDECDTIVVWEYYR